MGADGMRGCQQVKEHGGRIVVQDEATSVVWGMPGAIVGAGLEPTVRPLAEIGATIASWCVNGEGVMAA
jgi:two-component system chemotaxis response regulator CheB